MVASDGRRATAARGAAAMMRGCILLIALSAISLVILVLARSAVHLLHTDDVTASAIEGGDIPITRSLLQMPYGLSPPGSSVSNDYPFSVIIISYHKTGVSP